MTTYKGKTKSLCARTPSEFEWHAETHANERDGESPRRTRAKANRLKHAYTHMRTQAQAHSYTYTQVDPSIPLTEMQLVAVYRLNELLRMQLPKKLHVAAREVCVSECVCV